MLVDNRTVPVFNTKYVSWFCPYTVVYKCRISTYHIVQRSIKRYQTNRGYRLQIRTCNPHILYEIGYRYCSSASHYICSSTVLRISKSSATIYCATYGSASWSPIANGDGSVGNRKTRGIPIVDCHRI